MHAARLLKERIDSEILTTGVLATDHLWPALIERLKIAGIDYIIVDQEHGVHSDDLVAEVCALGRQVDFPVFIRPIGTDYSTIRKAVDCGPCGFLLPGIESAEVLDRVRDGIYMPPRGKRRPGGPGINWVSDLYYDTWKTEFEDNFIVLPQIETQVGLDHVDEIARHEITTAIAIGPYDLSTDLGVCRESEHPIMQEAVARIRQAGRDAGKNMWHIGDGPALARQGFTFLCIGEPVWIMAGALKTLNEKTKAIGEG